MVFGNSSRHDHSSDQYLSVVSRRPRDRLNFEDVFEYHSRDSSGIKIYKCLACDISHLPASNIRSHTGGRKHTNNLEKLRDKMRNQKNYKKNAIKIKAYNPPNHRDEDESTFNSIINTIDEPLVALEYAIEISPNSNPENNYYICALCNVRCDQKDFEDHLTSQKHRFGNLKRHFSPIASHLKSSRRFTEDSEFRSEVLAKISFLIDSESERGTAYLYQGSNFKLMQSEIYEYLNNKDHVTIKDFPNAQKDFLRGIDLFDNNWENENLEQHPKTESKDTFVRPAEPKRKQSVIDEYRQVALTAVKVFESRLIEYERNPDRHPYYKREWEKFWDKKADDLRKRGEDPKKFNFDQEWYKFFGKRIYEIHDEELMWKIEEIQKSFGLSHEEIANIEEIPTKKRKGNDEEKYQNNSKDHNEKSFDNEYQEDNPKISNHGSDMEKNNEKTLVITIDCDLDKVEKKVDSQISTSKNEKSDQSMEKLSQPSNEPSTLVKTCRLLAALEIELGLLATKVLELLSKSIAYERNESKSSNDLLFDNDNFILIETVKEKLIGLKLANLISNDRVKAVDSVLSELNKLIDQHEIMVKVKKTLEGMEKNEATPKEIEMLKLMFSKN